MCVCVCGEVGGEGGGSGGDWFNKYRQVHHYMHVLGSTCISMLHVYPCYMYIIVLVHTLAITTATSLIKVYRSHVLRPTELVGHCVATKVL